MMYNFGYDDGLEFLMIYDSLDISPESKINIKINSDNFSIEFFLDN